MNGQFATPGKELDEYQLLQRIDAAFNLGSEASRLYYGAEYRKATQAKRDNWERVREYANDLESLLGDILQLKLLKRMEALTPEERQFMLDRWKSGDQDELRLSFYYRRPFSMEELTSRIDEIGSKIGPKVMAIRDGLRAWDFDPSHPLWPKLVSDECTPCSDAAGTMPNCSRGPFRRTGSGDGLQGLVEAYIQVVLSRKGKVDYESVAALIIVDDTDVLNVLPTDYRKRIKKRFSGTLLEFIKDREANRDVIDFRERFIRTFSAAKRSLEKRSKVP